MSMMIYRAAGAHRRARTIDEKNRTVEVIAATENPVMIFDWDRGLIPEVLLMSGCQIPESGQIPLCDSHRSYETSTVIGSARSLRREGSELSGRAHFAKSAGEKWDLVADGHLTDFSVGYRISPQDSIWIPDGETAQVDGREWAGPLLIRKKWWPKELSLVPIGADESAKARSEMQIQKQAGTTGGTDDAIRREIIEAERNRVADIDALCRRHELAGMAPKFIQDGVSIETARAAVLEAIVAREAAEGHPATASSESFLYGRRDNEAARRDAIIDGLAIRAGVKLENPADGWREYGAGATLLDIARESLHAQGVRTSGLDKKRLAEEALKARGGFQTSDFPSIMKDTAAKIARKTFDGGNFAWRRVAVIKSVADFKEHHAVALGVLDDLEEVKEGAPFRYASRPADEGEPFAVSTFGRIFAITRQALINDSLGFFDVPRKFGLSASRKLESMVFGLLEANAAMADGNPIFSAAHGNLADTNLEAPSVASLDEGRVAMMRQKDPSDLQSLGIAPEQIVVPPEIITTTETLLASIADPGATHSGVSNVFRGKLEIVPSAALTDAAAWYLAARSWEPVWMGFLGGDDGPTIESRPGWEVAGVEFRIFLDAAAVVADHRSLFKNAGAA